MVRRGARAYTLLICRERRAVSLSARGIHVFFALFLAEATCLGGILC
jgi:hypothetical protein